MTVHRAKGLTFDTVYVPCLHAAPDRRERGSRSVEVGRREGVWELALLGRHTPGFERLAARQEETVAAEAIRTLYVALTRPRRRLILVGRWAAGALRPEPGSYLSLMLARRGGLPDLLRSWQCERSEFRDALGVRWRFLQRCDPIDP